MKINYLWYGLACLACAAAPAQAQVAGSLGGGGGPFLNLSNAGLNGGTVATLTGGAVLNSDQPYADIPAGSIFGNAFLAAGPTVTQAATLNFTTGVNYLSFLWGSPDLYNSLEITTNNATSQLFTAAGLGFPVTNGDQSFSQYVQFSALAGSLITSAVFTNVPATDAFETANFTVLSRDVQSGVPEPGTWAMMLLGIGAVGGAMRSSNRKSKLALAAA